MNIYYITIDLVNIQPTFYYQVTDSQEIQNA